MLDCQDFYSLCTYIESQSIEALIEPALRNQLIFYGCKNESEIQNAELRSELNKLTHGMYSVVLGDMILTQIQDIKDNLHKYKFLYETLLNDELSRNTLMNIMLYRLTYKGEHIAKAFSIGSRQYFDESIVSLDKDAVFVDCGGLDGATSVEFILRHPSYKRVYLYEPIEQLYENCKQNIAYLQLDNVEIRNAAVYMENSQLKFSQGIPGSSRNDENGEVVVQSVSLDNDIVEEVSFIKMDIEGSEKQAILGAKSHLQKDNPLLAICVYHLPSDLWEIPEMIYSIQSNYRFYLRHHTLNTNETVLYAVPQEALNLNNEDRASKVHQFYQNFKLREEKKIQDQISFLSSQVELKSKAIASLERWSQELKQGNQFLLDQIQKKDEVERELRLWISELESAKKWLEEQK